MYLAALLPAWLGLIIGAYLDHPILGMLLGGAVTVVILVPCGCRSTTKPIKFLRNPLLKEKKMARSSVGLSLYEKLNLAWRIIRSKPDNLVQHAQRELKLVDEHRNRSSVEPETELDRQWAAEMTKHTLEVITVFSTQEHSGFSAGYALNLLKSLLAFKPLTPLTGEDVEWVEAGEGVWQNNRCSTVFKDGAGKAWNIDGRVFIEPTGEGYTNVKSRVFVTFPCTPVTVYAREGNLEDAFPTFAEVLKAYAEAEPKKIITPQHH